VSRVKLIILFITVFWSSLSFATIRVVVHEKSVKLIVDVPKDLKPNWEADWKIVTKPDVGAKVVKDLPGFQFDKKSPLSWEATYYLCTKDASQCFRDTVKGEM
jgi:hypothetical protein